MNKNDSIAAGVCAALVAAASAHAQERGAAKPAQNEDLTEVVVTGSRIERKEEQIASPIMSITAEDLAATGKTNITDVLVRNPALTTSRTSWFSIGDDGTAGLNTLDLRNLGSKRTLVLVNGKRHVASVANSAEVDINTIPQELIEKVDVLTGGASAVYGADGVSGVVNFVLKRNFEGISARLQTGLSAESDGRQRFGSIVAGKNFAGDRGNVVVAYEFNESNRVDTIARPETGDPLRTYALFQNVDDFDVDDPDVYDRVPLNDLRWYDSAPDGAIDLDLDFVPDFTGSGLPYDRGVFIPASNGNGQGGSSTPIAGYYGDLTPFTKGQSFNVLGSFEIGDHVRVFAEGKLVNTNAFSRGQPNYDFYTYLAPDNAFLNDRFGVAESANGAYMTRDHLDLGFHAVDSDRETTRFVVGADGALSDHVGYEISYVRGETETEDRSRNSLLKDRYFAALDAVRDPQGRIVCRSTLDASSNIDPNNFDRPATSFTPGANSPCRPLNLLGNGVFSPEARAFVNADLLSRSKITQEVVLGSIDGTLDAWFRAPGGPVGFALGAEHRREESAYAPDDDLLAGNVVLNNRQVASGGGFDVNEVFGEINVPLVSDRRFAHLLSTSAAVRLSDYSTIGKTTTWKVDAVYAPTESVRFRGTLSQAVRAPNIGELFEPQGQTSDFVDDPCDFRALPEGTQYRVANCTQILSGLGLTPAEIAGFTPSSDPVNVTARRGISGGNPALEEETARTWTAGVVLRPEFLPRFSLSLDWYDIRIEKAVTTPSATKIAELCVDQPTIDNVFCDNIFRASDTGFILGDEGDPDERVGFQTLPQNVASFQVAGADLSTAYSVPTDAAGKFNLRLVGGYLQKISFVRSIGAEPDDELGEGFNPKWRGNLQLGWEFRSLKLDYSLDWFSKTLYFSRETIAAQPDISDPRYFHDKERWEHSLNASFDLREKFSVFAGVSNLFDQEPTISRSDYPVSSVGRYFYAGARMDL